MIFMVPGWFLMVFHGSSRAFIVFHGSRLISKVPCGLSWFSWFQVSFSWFQVGFHGFSWLQVGFSWLQVGFSWFQVGLHGIS